MSERYFFSKIRSGFIQIHSLLGDALKNYALFVHFLTNRVRKRWNGEPRVGFEPTTCRLQGGRSNQLSHRGTSLLPIGCLIFVLYSIFRILMPDLPEKSIPIPFWEPFTSNYSASKAPSASSSIFSFGSSAFTTADAINIPSAPSSSAIFTSSSVETPAPHKT